MAATDDVIRIPNHHVPSCGPMPEWVRDRPAGSYFGYFANALGEQFVFLATKDFAQLAGGDLGWQHVYRIDNPNWQDVDEWLVTRIDFDTATIQNPWPAIHMDAEEAAWLRACVRAASLRMSRRQQAANEK